MSNTTTVSPYETSVGAVSAGAAIVRWLRADTQEDQQIRERLEEERRRERLGPARPAGELFTGESEGSLASARLHMRDLESLVRSAEALGYRVEPLVRPTKPLFRQSQVLLKSASGDRLAVERSTDGLLAVHAKEGDSIQRLVRHNQSSRAAGHFRSRGMDLRTKVLPHGEAEIEATELGRTKIRAQILRDGSAQLDVDNMAGRTCEDLVRGTAEAMGAKVVSMSPKAAYFQLPGEPARVKVRG